MHEKKAGLTIQLKITFFKKVAQFGILFENVKENVKVKLSFEVLLHLKFAIR